MKLVNEPGEGVVKALLPKDMVRVEIDGFDYDYHLAALIITDKDDPQKTWYGTDAGPTASKQGHITRVIIDEVEAQPIQVSKKAGVQHTNLGYREVDLHIQNLVTEFRHLSNGEMLEIQLGHFEAQLKLALQYHEKKVVFIHGIGAGVLRAEIRQRLSAYPDMEYNDASHHLYGYGATEIHIL